VRANTLVRVDPAKNAVAAVIDVAQAPNATAVGGDSVWVYTSGNSVSEVDARTNDVRRTTKLSTLSIGSGIQLGPTLAADREGAWAIGYDTQRARYVLTRIRSGGGTRAYSFGLALRAVTVADGAVWILANRVRAPFVLQIDPSSGRVVARWRVPSAVLGVGDQGLAVGGGFVWMTDAQSATLFRLDPRTGDVRHARFGTLVSRPAVGFGHVWICSWDGEHGAMLRIDPRTLTNDLARDALPAEEGHFAVGFGSVWRHDVPSGTLMRFRPRNGDPEGLIPVAGARPGTADVDVTSVSAGAGAVWLSIS
jgi:outer membrane protein assembly factor BamB